MQRADRELQSTSAQDFGSCFAPLGAAPLQLSRPNDWVNVRRAKKKRGRTRLTDQPLQLPGYLVEPAACAVTARLGRRWQGWKPIPQGLVNARHYSPTPPTPTPFCLFNPPQASCETVRAILYAANRAAFLVPVASSSHR